MNKKIILIVAVILATSVYLLFVQKKQSKSIETQKSKSKTIEKVIEKPKKKK